MKTTQSPFLVMPLWALVAGALIGRWPSLWALVGAASWPLLEYVAHRWAMHGLERIAPRAYKRVHGVHHLYPSDLAHFTIPLAFSAPLVAAMLLVLPPSFVGGLLLAYVAYDLAHLAAHGKAPWPWRKAIASHHAAHHKHDRFNFGVTSSLLDRIGGTRWTDGPSS